MNRFLFLLPAIGISLCLATATCAQTTDADRLQSHLVRNAEVFAANGTAIGIIDSVELNGDVVVRLLHVPKTIPSMLYEEEDSLEPPAVGSGFKVVPIGVLQWTGYGLKANLTPAQVKGLQPPDDD